MTLAAQIWILSDSHEIPKVGGVHLATNGRIGNLQCIGQTQDVSWRPDLGSHHGIKHVPEVDLAVAFHVAKNFRNLTLQHPGQLVLVRLGKIEIRLDNLFQVVNAFGRISSFDCLFRRDPVVGQKIDYVGKPPDRLDEPEDYQGFIGRQSINVVNDNQKASARCLERRCNILLKALVTLIRIDQVPNQSWRGGRDASQDRVSSCGASCGPQQWPRRGDTGTELSQRHLGFLGF